MENPRTNTFQDFLMREKPLAVLIVLMTFIYSTLSLFKHWHFGTFAWDLGNFDQMIWHYSRFEAPGCTELGLKNCLGDHFSPISALCAPLFWICPHVEVLLVAQVILITSALIPIYLYSASRLTRWESYGVAAAFAVFWGVKNAIWSDYHPDCFAVPMIAWAIYFMGLLQNLWVKIRVKSPKYQLG
jgi:uncharacterized membrane protein